MADCGGCASARDRCGNGLEKIYPVTAVRYGKMGYIGEFTHDPDLAFTCGGKVIIQTERGIEIGEQVSFTCHGCSKSVSREALRSYVKASGSDCYRFNNGRILREATSSDLTEQHHLELEIADKLALCRRFIEQNNLPMDVVDAEHVFGGERIIFYFMAEDRVDFRELVRQLAREFQTRIEMRQVGARDEARLLADYETCGRECCCKNFLKVLKPVGMQMAKLQKATLDPSKVSGRCGRLKCCLRYEHETYSDLNKRLPRLGKRVRTATDEGVVIDRQILTQLVKIRKDDGTVCAICHDDIVERDMPPPAVLPASEQDSGDRQNRRGERPQRERRPAGPQRSPRPAAQHTERNTKRVEDPEPFGPEELPDDGVDTGSEVVDAELDVNGEGETTAEVMGSGEIAAPPPKKDGPGPVRPQPQKPRQEGRRRMRNRRRRDKRRPPAG